MDPPTSDTQVRILIDGRRQPVDAVRTIRQLIPISFEHKCEVLVSPELMDLPIMAFTSARGLFHNFGLVTQVECDHRYARMWINPDGGISKCTLTNARHWLRARSSRSLLRIRTARGVTRVEAFDPGLWDGSTRSLSERVAGPQRWVRRKVRTSHRTVRLKPGNEETDLLDLRQLLHAPQEWRAGASSNATLLELLSTARSVEPEAYAGYCAATGYDRKRFRIISTHVRHAHGRRWVVEDREMTANRQHEALWRGLHRPTSFYTCTLVAQWGQRLTAALHKQERKTDRLPYPPRQREGPWPALSAAAVGAWIPRGPQLGLNILTRAWHHFMGLTAVRVTQLDSHVLHALYRAPQSLSVYANRGACVLPRRMPASVRVVLDQTFGAGNWLVETVAVQTVVPSSVRLPLGPPKDAQAPRPRWATMEDEYTDPASPLVERCTIRSPLTETIPTIEVRTRGASKSRRIWAEAPGQLLVIDGRTLHRPVVPAEGGVTHELVVEARRKDAKAIPRLALAPASIRTKITTSDEE